MRPLFLGRLTAPFPVTCFLTSLNKFDKLEIRNVIRGILSPTQREICLTANYYRAFANVESILALNHAGANQQLRVCAGGSSLPPNLNQGE